MAEPAIIVFKANTARMQRASQIPVDVRWQQRIPIPGSAAIAKPYSNIVQIAGLQSYIRPRAEQSFCVSVLSNQNTLRDRRSKLGG